MGWSADIAIEMGRKFEKYDIYGSRSRAGRRFCGYRASPLRSHAASSAARPISLRYDLRRRFFINRLPAILQPIRCAAA